jgi:hypothetical protein
VNTESDTLEPFEFRSVLYKRFLWTALLLVLLLDAISIPTILANRAEMSVIMLVLVIAGISIRVGLLVVLLIKKGPIDVFVYTWGGLFIFSGSTGLLSFVLSADPVPLVAYLDKGFFLILGLLLVVPFSKSVAKIGV